MKKIAICIGREYGSGGREIAINLAKTLNIPLYDKLLIKDAAKEYHYSSNIIKNNDEKPIEFSFMLSGNPLADLLTINDTFYSLKEKTFEMERNIIIEKASLGPCVIIGRCASSILKDENYNVISIFIYGDKKDKINRISKRNNISLKEAEIEMKKKDSLRKKYFDFYSSSKWGEKESYDIMISSSKYGINKASLILKDIINEITGDDSDE